MALLLLAGRQRHRRVDMFQASQCTMLFKLNLVIDEGGKMEGKLSKEKRFLDVAQNLDRQVLIRYAESL